MPARPYKPRDKAKVESAVQVAQRWIMAALRHRKFFSVEEANQAIGELLDRLNHRPFRKREGSRASVFEALDKPALKPLPAARRSTWANGRGRESTSTITWPSTANFYSVPYNLVQELVEIRSTATTVEILHKGARVASHLRSRGRGQAVTMTSIGPRVIRRIWSGRRRGMVQWAQNDRAAHRSAIRADNGRQAAPGDGLSRVPGHHPAGRTVLALHAWRRRRNGRC